MILDTFLRVAPHIRLGALLLALPVLTGCGGGGYAGGGGDSYGPPYVPPATVVAENDTATLPDTVMHDFRLWFAGDPPSGGNLLSAPLFPGEWEAVADVLPDYYDADAFMSDGLVDYLEVWSGIYVSGGMETVFFAY
jgi:hypothetical protein